MEILEFGDIDSKQCKSQTAIVDSLQIKDDPILGRHLVAARDFHSGELIFLEEALISGPNICEEGLPICLSCYSLVQSQYRCSNCRWPVCNATCEKNSRHAGFECPIFSSAEVSPDHLLGAESVTVLRCLLLKEKWPRKWKAIKKLESHQESRTEDTDAITFLYATLTFIQQICGLVHFDYDLIDLVTGIVRINELGAEDRQRAALFYRYGSYLYEMGSLLAHNCIPNAHRLINLHSELEVYASVPIKKGQIIWTTYTESLLGSKERNQVLTSLYYFSCSCDRCTDPTEISTLTQALKCQDCQHQNQQIPNASYLVPIKPSDANSDWKCSGCGQIRDDSYISGLKETFREEAETIGSDRSMEKVFQLEQLGGKYRGVTLHPNHFLILQIEYDIVQRMSYILYKNTLIRFQVAVLQRFIDLTRKLLSIYDVILPGFNSHRGRLLYFLQQGLLYRLQYKLNPNCKNRVDAKSTSCISTEIQEFLKVRKEGEIILALEPTGSEESLLAKEMSFESQEILELKRLSHSTNNNENEMDHEKVISPSTFGVSAIIS